jgi:hypothetical protein
MLEMLWNSENPTREPMHMPLRYLPLAVLHAAILIVASSASADVAQEMEDHINSLGGTEVAGLEFTFTAAGVDVTFVLDGYSLCMPSSPTLPPVDPPIPPLNSYGCVNAAEIVGTPVANPPGVDLAMSIDPLFIDFTTSRGRTSLCGEFTPGTEVHGGYATMSVNMAARIRFNEQNGCIRWMVVPGSTDFFVGAADMTFDDSCLAFYAQVAILAIMSTLETQLEAQLIELFDDFIWQRNVTTCGVSVQTTSWAAMKANFD